MGREEELFVYNRAVWLLFLALGLKTSTVLPASVSPLCSVGCRGTGGVSVPVGPPGRELFGNTKLLLGHTGSFASFFRLTQSCYFTAVTVTALAPVPNLSRSDGCGD